MNITMPRGDLRPVVFTLTNVGEIQITEIYFTVKKTYYEDAILFQKRLSNGEIEPVEGSENAYQFFINPEDTDSLEFRQYVFDIEVVGDGLKQTFTGDLILTCEATHASNE